MNANIRPAADLPKGTRVMTPKGRPGTVSGYDVGHVTNPDHPNYGRAYVGVDMDPIEGDKGCGRRGRFFVDELTTETATEAPRYSETVYVEPAPCPVYPTWCLETGDHTDHMGGDVDVASPSDRPDDVAYLSAYLGCYLLDLGAGPKVGFDAGGAWVDLDAAGLRAEVVKIRDHCDRLDALADQLATIETDTGRCTAARQLHGLTPCDGPGDAVHVHDHPIGGHGATVDGCEHHATALLASLEGTGRVHPGSAGDGSALRVYKAAQTLRDRGDR